MPIETPVSPSSSLPSSFFFPAFLLLFSANYWPTHLSFAPAIYPKLGFDPRTDLAPSSLVANQTFVVAAAQSLPVANMQEFIALAKKSPGKLSYGSGGVGSASHLGTEMLRIAGGFNLLHVPYKGTGPGMAAIMGGEIQILLVGLATVLPHVKAKNDKLKVFAVTSAKRSAAAPDIPTVAESGLPGYEFDVWYGMVFPGGTPRGIVGKASTEIVRLLKTPALRERFSAAGLEPLGNTPEEFAAQIRSEIPKWLAVARAAKINVD